MNKASSGVWIAVGFCLKPILIALYAFPLFKKDWKMLLYSFLSLILISVLTILFIGQETFISFFTNNPIIKGVPDNFYTEEVNQSLLATILRITEISFSGVNPFFLPISLAAAAAILIPSLFIIYKLDRKDNFLSVALIISSAIIVYPGSIDSYSPLVIPILAFLVSYSDDNNVRLNFILMICFLVYTLMSFSPFASHSLLWLLLIFIGLNKIGLRNTKRMSSSKLIFKT
jgi:hypothetical protein